MSERSRRRRRRRRTSSGGEGQRRVERETPEGQPVAREQASSISGRSRRRRRGRSRTGGERTGSPKSSEDLVRALPRERPTTLTAPADGQTLEGLIGELQSEYGVPQYPQEYRITLKVAEERGSAERPAPEEGDARVAPPPTVPGNGSPRREKAPAMNAGEPAREQTPGAAPRKRSRRRRRRRGSGGGAGGAPAPPS
jgi:hypothetical protein